MTSHLQHLPGYSDHPSHLVLPQPYAEFCLTRFVGDDLGDIRRLVTSPHCVPYFGPKGPDDPKLENHMKWMKHWYETETSFPFTVIRKSADVQRWNGSDSTRPAVIGTIGFEKDAYHNANLEETERAKLEAANRAKADDQSDWILNMVLLDPDYTGQGLMRAVLKFCLENWFIPINTRPGQLASAWEYENRSSRRLHEALGFEIIGRLPETGKPNHIRYIAAIWQESGRFRKQETAYHNLPDFVDEDNI